VFVSLESSHAPAVFDLRSAFPRDMAVGTHGTTPLVSDDASGQLEAVNVRTLP
jgi:hypothetical protein